MLRIYRACFSFPLTGKIARPAEFLRAADDGQAMHIARQRAGNLVVELWCGTRRVAIDGQNEIRVNTDLAADRPRVLRQRARQIDEALRENTGPQWRAAKRLAQSYRDEALKLERERKTDQ